MYRKHLCALSIALAGALASPHLLAQDILNDGGLISQFVKSDSIRMSSEWDAGNVQAGILMDAQGKIVNNQGGTIRQTLNVQTLDMEMKNGLGNIQAGILARGVAGIENRGEFIQEADVRQATLKSTRTALSTQGILAIIAGSPSTGSAVNSGKTFGSLF